MGSAVIRRRHHVDHGPDTAETGWDVIDEHDVVGTASARLLSTGVARCDRLAALSLLGLLLDHADEAGRIRLPLDALAGELEVEVDRAVRLLQHLVAVEAVHAEAGAVVVVGHHSQGGDMAPSRFLANLMTVLERDPVASGPQHSGPARRMTGARHQSEPGTRRRALVALSVGLAAMALTTAPSGEPVTSLRTVSAPSAPTGRPPWATLVPTPTSSTLITGEVLTGEVLTGEGLAADDEPGRAGDDDSGRGGVSAPGEEASEVAGEPGAGNAGDARAPGRSELSPPPLRTSPERPSTGSSPPGPPPAPAPGDRPATPPVAGITCPVGGPEANVSGTVLLGAGPSNALDLAGERTLQVSGTVVNTSEAALTVTAVEVGAGQGADRRVEATGTVPVAIPPGGTATWEVRLLAGVSSATEPGMDVRVTDWSWVDPGFAAACAS